VTLSKISLQLQYTRIPNYLWQTHAMLRKRRSVYPRTTRHLHRGP